MLRNRSIPSATVIPELAYPDIGAAIDWLCATFGFNLRLRIGDHRAQLTFADGAVVLTELPAGAMVSPDAAHSMLVRVENVDRHFRRAARNGAKILREPEDHPYGERQYTVEDFAGRRWTFSQSLADIDPVSWGGTPGLL